MSKVLNPRLLSLNISDYTPRKEHVVFEDENGVEYYCQELFKESVTFQERNYVPLFIKDVLNLKAVSAVYFQNPLLRNLYLLQNHPFQKIRVTGRVLAENVVTIKEEKFYLLSIDDSSSAQYLTCKLSEARYLGCGLVPDKSYGKILILYGELEVFKDIKELHAEYAEVIGNEGDLSVELEQWKEYLDFRKKILSKPWVVNIHEQDENDAVINIDSDTDQEMDLSNKLKIDYKDLLGKENENHLNVYHCGNDRKLNEIIPVQDTLKIPHIHGKKSNNKINNNNNNNRNKESIEIIDLTSEDDNISVKLMESQFKAEFLKWCIMNNEERFSFAKPLGDENLNDILNQLAMIKYNNMNLKTRAFHDIRHELTKYNKLIKCTKSMNCKIDNFLTLFHNLLKYLNNIKIRNDQDIHFIKKFNSLKYIKNYSKMNNGINLEIDVLNELIKWITTSVLADNGEMKWEFAKDTNEWSYKPADDTAVIELDGL
ncbi:hypothetical protein PACTADRAFT_35953 [Pachysolen tannophilus NRRL Y-2460]|uniref:CST complex subunit Stn1 N-terminal domain-containing protein n=1 Tax=Pachysolen tannophilus NRRL Y-2460 TaxID=669874 RepID=A0A1E4TNI7_PACTA|nr:hypothetical protein PACTADRAFT_35953 [Pachysolen tannophilus NRRL Y-2460]